MSTSPSDLISIQDYVAGRLSHSECEALEDRLITDPGLLRDFEESLRFREGLELLREQHVLESLTSPRRRGLLKGARWAAAVALVVVCAALYWSARYGAERSPPLVAASIEALHGNSASTPGTVQRYSFAAMRDQASIPELPLSASGTLEVRALTAVTDASRTFKATLSQIRNDKTSLIGSVQHVVPDADGFVAIYADAARLTPGDYWLSVESEAAGNQPGSARFEFRLKRIPD